jgi:hypothetical protein
MCRDIGAVGAAVTARLDVHTAACASGDRRCRFFDGCPKQVNRQAVDAADVIFASYDALFTGLHIKHGSIGMLLIDEGCWGRAVNSADGLHLESLADDLMEGCLGRASSERDHIATATLLELRRRVATAIAANGCGPLGRSRLEQAALSSGDCSDAALLEERRLRDPGLRPGLSAAERQEANAQAAVNERTHRYIAFWRATADLLAGPRERHGRVHIREGEAGMHEVVVTGTRAIHPTLRGKPVLHLDATLRPELARTILPDLEVTEIDAAAPHMSVRLVTGTRC